MRTMIAALSLLILLGFSAASIAQEQQPLRYAVVYSDDRGVTRFRDEYLPWLGQGPGTPPPSLTAYLDAEKIGFLRLPKGYYADWHPSPGKRFVMVLSGVGQVEVGDGERRTFAPGSVLLVTDISGQGHRTSVIGDQDVLIAWVPVP
jgi:hypothetical protein